MLGNIEKTESTVMYYRTAHINGSFMFLFYVLSEILVSSITIIFALGTKHWIFCNE